MSTDLTNRTPPDRDRPEPAKPRIDLSATQVLGGALAAMTAAFLGSRLSVAGTVVGAALASIVAAVAGNLYTASLRSTREKVRTVFQGRVDGSSMPATVTTVDTTPADPATDEAWHWSAAAAPAPAAAAPPAPATDRPAKRWSVRSMVLGALAAFALAAAVLTGLELATGQALSGGHGTTISQVGEAEKPAPRKDPSPAATAGTASPSPSASASPIPSATATTSSTPTASAAPTEQPDTSAPAPSTPAAAPSASASANDPGTPSSTPEPSGASTPGANG